MRDVSTAIAALIASALILACATKPSAATRGSWGPSLFGMVYDDDSVPVAGAVVSLDGGLRATSDVNGRFAMPAPEQGGHSLLVEKELFETAREEFEYRSAVQLLYVKLISAKQLVARAERALERRELALASETLGRALALSPGDIEARYAAAIVAFRGGKIREAKRLLAELAAEGCGEPSVFLFLADIAQFAEKNEREAVGYLKRSLELRCDPDVEARLGELARPGELDRPDLARH